MNKLQYTKFGLFRIVTSKNNGDYAWWILKLEPLKEKIFEKDVELGKALNLDSYGVVLKKGYGENPPEEIIQEIKDMIKN
ncbi:MAG: hypothetical protein SFT90_08075 [Rickettsiales bacterium]|nr:hypothetical protein [Rickettsiales bacterium]